MEYSNEWVEIEIVVDEKHKVLNNGKPRLATMSQLFAIEQRNLPTDFRASIGTEENKEDEKRRSKLHLYLYILCISAVVLLVMLIIISTFICMERCRSKKKNIATAEEKAPMIGDEDVTKN